MVVSNLSHDKDDWNYPLTSEPLAGKGLSRLRRDFLLCKSKKLMKIYDGNIRSIRNCRQEIEFNSSLLTGATIANRHQRGVEKMKLWQYIHANDALPPGNKVPW